MIKKTWPLIVTGALAAWVFFSDLTPGEERVATLLLGAALCGAVHIIREMIKSPE